MKSLMFALLLMSLEADAKVDLPILGEYQLHQQLEGGCFNLSKRDVFYISFSERVKEYSIGSRGTRRQHFQYGDETITSLFLRVSKLGVQRSEPTERGLVYTTSFSPFNEGRGIHASQVIGSPDNSYRSVIVDATFEVDGEFLFANFRNTRLMNNVGAGKCILKKVQSN